MSHIIVDGKVKDVVDVLSSRWEHYYNGYNAYVFEVTYKGYDIVVKVVGRLGDVMISVVNSSYFVDNSMINEVLVDVALTLKGTFTFKFINLPRKLLRIHGIIDS